MEGKFIYLTYRWIRRGIEKYTDDEEIYEGCYLNTRHIVGFSKCRVHDGDLTAVYVAGHTHYDVKETVDEIIRMIYP